MDQTPSIVPPLQPAPAPPSSPALSGFGELLSLAWREYLWLLKQIWPLLLVIFVLGSAIPSFLASLVPKEAQVITVSVSVVLGLLAGVVATLFLPVTGLLFLKAKSDNLAIDLSSAFRASRHLLWPFAWLLLLSNLVTLGGFLLLVIPGIMASVWMSFSMFALIFEGRKGLDALLRSAGLVIGNSWGVFWRWLGFVAVVLLLTGILSIPGFLFAGVSFLGNLPEQNLEAPQDAVNPFSFNFSEEQLVKAGENASDIASVWGNLVDLAVAPFGMAFGFALFEDLRRVKGAVVAEERRRQFKLFAALGIVAIALLIAALAWVVTLLPGALNDLG